MTLRLLVRVVLFITFPIWILVIGVYIFSWNWFLKDIWEITGSITEEFFKQDTK